MKPLFTIIFVAMTSLGMAQDSAQYKPFDDENTMQVLSVEVVEMLLDTSLVRMNNYIFCYKDTWTFSISADWENPAVWVKSHNYQWDNSVNGWTYQGYTETYHEFDSWDKMVSFIIDDHIALD